MQYTLPASTDRNVRRVVYCFCWKELEKDSTWLLFSHDVHFTQSITQKKQQRLHKHISKLWFYTVHKIDSDTEKTLARSLFQSEGISSAYVHLILFDGTKVYISATAPCQYGGNASTATWQFLLS